MKKLIIISCSLLLTGCGLPMIASGTLNTDTAKATTQTSSDAASCTTSSGLKTQDVSDDHKDDEMCMSSEEMKEQMKECMDEEMKEGESCMKKDDDHTDDKDEHEKEDSN